MPAKIMKPRTGKNEPQVAMTEELVAPCGMNCALCANYLAKALDLRAQGFRMPHCAGCRPRGKMCAFLKKKCDRLRKAEIVSCHECPDVPCPALRTIDARYRERYRMSMIENLQMIRDNGMAAFLRSQAKTWRCPECGGIVSCHNGLCFHCDIETLKRRNLKYRWESE